MICTSKFLNFLSGYNDIFFDWHVSLNIIHLFCDHDKIYTDTYREKVIQSCDEIILFIQNHTACDKQIVMLIGHAHGYKFESYFSMTSTDTKMLDIECSFCVWLEDISKSTTGKLILTT